MPASGIRRVDIVDIAWIIKYVGGTLAMQGGAQRAHPTDMGEERVFRTVNFLQVNLMMAELKFHNSIEKIHKTSRYHHHHMSTHTGEEAPKSSTFHNLKSLSKLEAPGAAQS